MPGRVDWSGCWQAGAPVGRAKRHQTLELLPPAALAHWRSASQGSKSRPGPPGAWIEMETSMGTIRLGTIGGAGGQLRGWVSPLGSTISKG